MPTPADLLARMRVIASDALWLAVLWHVVLVVALLAVGIDAVLVLGAISLVYLAARLRDAPGQRTLSHPRSSP